MIPLIKILGHSFDDNMMNRDLETLYLKVLKEYGPKWWAWYKEQEDPEDGFYPANPYLTTATDSYISAKKRVLLVAQETFSWGSEFGDCGAFHLERNVQELMSLYDLCLKEKSLTTPLWRFGREIEERSGASVIFDNIAMVGWCGRRGFSPELQPRILSDKISILNPSMIIFATGPTRQYMNELAANGITPSCKVPLVSKDGYSYAEEWKGFGKKMLWCCHPKFLSCEGVIEEVISTMETLILDNA